MSISSGGLESMLAAQSALEARSSNYSAHERGQWDADGFETWFEAAPRQSGRMEAAAEIDKGNEAGKLSAQPPRAGRGADKMPTSISSSVLLASPVNLLPDSSQGLVFSDRFDAGVAVSTPELAEQTPEAGGDPGEPLGEIRSRSSVAENVEQQEAKVTIGVSGSDVNLWVRDTSLNMEAMRHLRQIVARELSWSGLALIGLKINGHELVHEVAALPGAGSR